MAVAHERRTRSAITEVVDEALDIVNRCGWRYALAYLIHHRVSQEVIQRLLSGASVRPRRRADTLECRRIRTWRGAIDDDMAMLFDSLRQRSGAPGSAIG